MPANIEIQQARLSLIRVETNVQLLGNPQPTAAPLGFLGNRDSYAAMFDQAQKHKAVPLGLKVPWDKPLLFWKYYLEKEVNLAGLPGDKAWRFLVPFRGLAPATARAAWPGAGNLEIEMDSFFYPHGLALVLTATFKDTQSLMDTVRLAFKVMKEEKLDVEWDDGTQEQMSLNKLVEKCLEKLRQMANGQTAPGSSNIQDAFTIFTVLQGDGVDPQKKPDKGKAIHRALEAVTEWPALWETTQNFPALDAKVKFPLRKSPANEAGDLVYARARGRALWFPSLFTYAAKPLSSLSCYHKNLVWAALQLESLYGLASLTAKEINNNQWDTLTVMHRDCATLAAGLLGRMYGGGKDETYRSMSTAYHIQQNKYEPDINTLRKKRQMPDLSLPKP